MALTRGTNTNSNQGDWRVKLALAYGATYLYKDPDNKLMAPLANTDGVVFPYTPTISVSYNAAYDTTAHATHSNYVNYSYSKSNVDSIRINCDFTAQDTYEANYLLATIHFFRSLTKMFFGQDQDPKPGTPPPMVFLYGLGEFQFYGHPLVVNNFTYTLPKDVDYIRANAQVNIQSEYDQKASTDPSGQTTLGTVNVTTSAKKPTYISKVTDRLKQGVVSSLGSVAGGLIKNATGGILGSLQPGGTTTGSADVGGKPLGITNLSAAPVGSQLGGLDPTYVPTQINLEINCYPLVSRYKQSQFSYSDYAKGFGFGYW